MTHLRLVDGDGVPIEPDVDLEFAEGLREAMGLHPSNREHDLSTEQIATVRELRAVVGDSDVGQRALARMVGHLLREIEQAETLSAQLAMVRAAVGG